MKTIADEIRNYLEVSGSTQAELSKASGIPPSSICNLLKGKRKHLIGPNQDAIRAAMARLIGDSSPRVSHTTDP